MLRTGRLTGTTRVLIPWLDTDGIRQYTTLNITGKIYASKLYAGIREFVRENFGVEVDKDWLEHVPLIVNSNDPMFKVTEEERNKMIEEFINFMELKDEGSDQDERHTENKEETTGETVRAMPSLLADFNRAA